MANSGLQHDEGTAPPFGGDSEPDQVSGDSDFEHIQASSNSDGDGDVDSKETKKQAYNQPNAKESQEEPRVRGKGKSRAEAEPRNPRQSSTQTSETFNFNYSGEPRKTVPKTCKKKKKSEIENLQPWGFFSQGESTRRQTKIKDYTEKAIKDIPFRPAASPAKLRFHRRESVPEERAAVEPASQARWKERQREEDTPHSKAHPFLPNQDDVRRWLNEGPPQPQSHPKTFTQIHNPEHSLKKSIIAMRDNGYVPRPNGTSRSNIVEEYLSPVNNDYVDYSAFKNLSNAEKQAVIEREAQEYGLEKPQGYKVSFHYNANVEYHHFGSSHPMKPWRLTLTKQLVLAYGLEYTMDTYEPRPAEFRELKQFHNEEYLTFLSQVTPQNAKPDDPAYLAFGFGGESNDCPVFDGLWNYVSLYSGASMHAAQNLNANMSDIAINWSGGLHHAKKNVASGFCYVNDIVLAIQLLLSRHQRVLYIDIDVHHGDGVEAAFESSDRVFTLSYHKFGTDRNGYPFFPGTGNIDDMGPKSPDNPGKGHCLNIPIDDGIDDDQYKWLFKTVTGAVIEKYNPGAIVLQSGADSLGGDRLGRFNLNITAHGFCVETVKGYGRPLLLIGGGGYTPRNVARTWCHETAVCVGAQLHNDLPTHLPYIQAFQGEENGGGILYPDLHNTKRHDNLNTNQKLHKLVEQAMENLRYIEGAPSVVCNTLSIPLEKLMQIRADVDAMLEDEKHDSDHLSVEQARRKKERNTGGRHERGMR